MTQPTPDQEYLDRVLARNPLYESDEILDARRTHLLEQRGSLPRFCQTEVREKVREFEIAARTRDQQGEAIGWAPQTLMPQSESEAPTGDEGSFWQSQGLIYIVVLVAGQVLLQLIRALSK